MDSKNEQKELLKAVAGQRKILETLDRSVSESGIEVLGPLRNIIRKMETGWNAINEAASEYTDNFCELSDEEYEETISSEEEAIEALNNESFEEIRLLNEKTKAEPKKEEKPKVKRERPSFPSVEDFSSWQAKSEAQKKEPEPEERKPQPKPPAGSTNDPDDLNVDFNFDDF